MSVADASKPTYLLSGSARLLVLKLHDGKAAAKAVERRQGIGALSDATMPGTKVDGLGLGLMLGLGLGLGFGLGLGLGLGSGLAVCSSQGLGCHRGALGW